MSRDLLVYLDYDLFVYILTSYEYINLTPKLYILNWVDFNSASSNPCFMSQQLVSNSSIEHLTICLRHDFIHDCLKILAFWCLSPVFGFILKRSSYCSAYFLFICYWSSIHYGLGIILVQYYFILTQFLLDLISFFISKNWLF